MNNIIVTIDENIKTQFFKEINDESDSENNDQDDNNRCLISYDILRQNFIKLPCDHSFNYFPLYNEICNQKLNVNFKEIVRLKIYQIKCPYCRTVHNNLIPFYEMDGVISKHGVTKPTKYVLFPDNCNYIFKSGARKKQICHAKCIGSYCKTHKNLKHTKPVNNEVDNELTNAVINKSCTVILKSGKKIGTMCERTNCKYHK